MPATRTRSPRPNGKDCGFRCVRKAHADATSLFVATRDRGARCVAVEDSGVARRLRRRPVERSAAASRAARPRSGASIDIDRTATTPERFLKALTAVSPFPVADTSSAGPGSARAAFDATLGFFTRARTAASEPATFLLDEFLELRTFESFPGLRRVQHEFVDGLAGSGNRFVLTSRYTARALRLLRDRSARFEVIHIPALTPEDTLDMLGPIARGRRPGSRFSDAHGDRLADGRPAYVRGLVDELALMREHGGAGQRRRDRRAGGAARAGRASVPSLQLLLRAAPASRPRLRRAEGNPRNPRRGRRPDPHRDLAASAAHARLDQGLSVLARRRRSGDVAPEALQLHRSAAARLGPAALPPVGTER